MAWLTAAGAIAASLIAIATLVGMAWRGGRRVFRSMVDQVRGVVTESTDPIRAEVRDVGRRVTAIEAELRPNGGSSLRDAVDRVERTVTPES